MKILQTERLTLQQLTPSDAPFILELLNEPAFHKYIGDKGIRKKKGALEYLEDGPLASYRNHGYGLYLVNITVSDCSIGICGLKKREVLKIPDLGYAFLKKYWEQGYATEAGRAVLDYARKELKLSRIAAITHPENEQSIKVLTKLGFQLEKTINLSGFNSPNKLFEIDLN
ncbi:GNAT family N-acetyltransferase [Fodinibius sp.]|uniref:GNAT family N-acetyltransferase n=1 Tax=Fodinibius sp. TaxID=1872440 RepID=UPI002ACDC69D|nr:GNAT family N-acetyltransferase [Fodinibius sp.]MDZ7659134.1 GNAT family N-acetyltransferase [Fodinibius sp.]